MRAALTLIVAIIVTTVFLAMIPDANAIDMERFKVNGQNRVRYESHTGKDLDLTTGSGSKGDFTSMRSRLDFDFHITDSMDVFFQPQFVKTFGAPTATTTGNTSGTTTDGGTFLMHQAYTTWSPISPMSFLLGRQEMVYGDQVEFGKMEWNNTGRAFDGLRMNVNHAWGKTNFFTLKLTDDDTMVSTNPNDEVDLYGFYNSIDLGIEWLKEFDVFFL